MSTHKRIDAVCIIAVLLTLAFTLLLMGVGVIGLIPVMSQTGSTYFTVNDLNGGWDYVD